MVTRAAVLGVVGLLVACGNVREGDGPWVMTQGADGGDDDGEVGSESLDDGSDDVHATMADDDAGDDETGHADVTGHGDVTGDASDDGSDDGGGDGATGGADCPDNCYCEPLDPDADVSDLEAAYSPAQWDQTLFEVLQRRWPAGASLLMDKAGDPYFGSFSDTSSFASLMDGLMTEAHEGTHGWDYGNAGVDTFSYFLRGDLKFYPAKLDGFPRGEIYAMVEGTATDLYDDLYLTGDQGTYGFYELLDEGNCYINGMAAIGVVGDYIPYGISGRDGAVAFLYYLELYLKLARTQYPDVYDQIKGDPDYVELIKIQWLRTHFHLIYSADLHDNLGIYDAEIEELLYADENQSEIEMLIDHELDASNCLP